jgi:co-chaperonin GroES (HSP10)
MSPDDLARIKPTSDQLVIHLRPGVQETKYGIILPPSAQQITQYGDILAIGPDCTLVQLGQVVLIPLHAGTELCWLKNTPVLLVKESDLLAIVESPDDIT